MDLQEQEISVTSCFLTGRKRAPNGETELFLTRDLYFGIGSHSLQKRLKVKILFDKPWKNRNYKNILLKKWNSFTTHSYYLHKKLYQPNSIQLFFLPIFCILLLFFFLIVLLPRCIESWLWFVIWLLIRFIAALYNCNVSISIFTTLSIYDS